MNERLDMIDTDELRGKLMYQLSIISELIQTDDIKIVTKKLVGYNSPALIIFIPIYKGEDKNNIAVSIVQSSKDSVRYNYEIVDSSLVSQI